MYEINEKEPSIDTNAVKSLTVKYNTKSLIALSILIGSLLIAGSILYGANIVKKNLNSIGNKFSEAQKNSLAASQAQIAAMQQSAPAVQPAAAPAAQVNVTYKPDAPMLGNANAKVTIVEFADFQCPFCGKFFKDTVSDLRTKYVDTGKAKLVFQDFAFLGAESNVAAEAAKCAGEQGKFWQFHDYLYTHQAGENQGAFSADNLKKMAPKVGLNILKFNNCVNSGKYKQAVLDETNAGKTFGVSGTPTVFVNGKSFVGAQDATVFEQAIETALKL